MGREIGNLAEERVTLALAASRVVGLLTPVGGLVRRDPPGWEAAAKAVAEAIAAVEGYEYGYAEPDGLLALLRDLADAIGGQNVAAVEQALERVMEAAGGEYGRGELGGQIARRDGGFEVILMQPGVGNGFTWPREVLARDYGVLEGMTSFTNHERADVAAARPGGRTIDDICGVVYAVRWDDAAACVRSHWRPAPPRGPWVSDMIDQIVRDRTVGLPVPNVGMSVDVSFAHRNKVVTRLVAGHTADVVFNAALGPQYGEAFARVANAVAGAIDLSQRPVSVEVTPSDATQRMLARLAVAVVDKTLEAANLPAAAAERVRAQFAGQAEVDVGQLDVAIGRERAYLASLMADQVIKGVGGEDRPPARRQIGGVVFAVSDPMDRIRLAVDRFFGLEVPADAPRIDITRLYADLTGDVNVRGRFDIPEARERTGLANITDVTFAGVVADSMNKAVISAWQMMSGAGYEWWKAVVHEQDFDSLHQVDWITYGGFGDLPELAPGQSYPELDITKLDTLEKTGDWVKPGGIISVPIETFDRGARTGAFQGLPRALGVAEVRSLSAKVAAVFTANGGVGPTLSDGKALFHVDHANLRTTDLSFAAWEEVIQDQYKQTEQNSGKRMGIRPYGLLVPIEREGLGIQVLSNWAEHDTEYRNINPYQYAAERVIVVPDWIDANDWATFVDNRAYPSIGVGYRFGRQPTVEAEPGGMGSMGVWTQDALRWKVRWFYLVSVINYRGLQKRNVT